MCCDLVALTDVLTIANYSFIVTPWYSRIESYVVTLWLSRVCLYRLAYNLNSLCNKIKQIT